MRYKSFADFCFDPLLYKSNQEYARQIIITFSYKNNDNIGSEMIYGQYRCTIVRFSVQYASKSICLMNNCSVFDLRFNMIPVYASGLKIRLVLGIDVSSAYHIHRYISTCLTHCDYRS